MTILIDAWLERSGPALRVWRSDKLWRCGSGIAQACASGFNSGIVSESRSAP